MHRDPNNPDVTDRTSYKRWAAAARAAFPDLTVTINDLIAEDDRVAKLWSLTATHKGEYLGIAPTGRRVTRSPRPSFEHARWTRSFPKPT